MRKILSLLLAILFSASSAAAQLTIGGRLAPATINGFSFCRPYRADHLKVSNTAIPATSYVGFPALFASSVLPELQADLRTVANGGLVTSDFAFDVVIYPDALGGAGGAKLAHEIDYYNPVTGLLFINFLQELSVTTPTLVYVCGGKASITTSQEDITGTWNSNYKARWGFGDGTTLSLLDSTSNNVDATNVNAATAVLGQVGGAVHFTKASNQRLSLGTPFALGSTGLPNSRTLELWYKIDSVPIGSDVFSLYSRTGEDGGMQLHLTPTGLVFIIHGGAAAGSATVVQNVAPKVGDKKHVAITYDRTLHTIWMYVDGALVATYDFYPGSFNNDQTALIGGTGSAGSAFDGWVDEDRFSNVARPYDWTRTSFLQQLNPAIIWSSGPRL